jgi:hypothetical protein
VICLHSLTNESKDSAIFADLDTGDLRNSEGNLVRATRLNKGELFDETSMNNLKKYGIITNYCENKFLQVVNNDYIVEALRVNVNVCLNVIANTLNMDLLKIEGQKVCMSTVYNIPFYSTKDYISRYYQSVQIENGIKVRAGIVGEGSEDEWVKYDPQTHGYNALGNFPSSASGELLFIDLSNEYIQLKSVRQTMNYAIPINDFSGRETYTRSGNSHNDEVTLPKKDHKFFVATFWENPLVDKNIDFIGDINSYFGDDFGV